MISVIDVIRQISIYLRENYQSYTLLDRDMDETTERPCLFVDVDDLTSEVFADEYIRDTMTISIFAFCKDLDSGFLDCLQFKNSVMAWLSNPIAIYDVDCTTRLCTIVCQDIEAEISKADKAVKVTFKTELVQQIESDESMLSDILDLEMEAVNG